jgi:hypothetical protein
MERVWCLDVHLALCHPESSTAACSSGTCVVEASKPGASLNVDTFTVFS